MIASGLKFKEKQYLQLLKKAGLRQNEVFNCPDRNDFIAYRYCPFCETDFLKGVDKCPDCKINFLKYDGITSKK